MYGESRWLQMSKAPRWSPEALAAYDRRKATQTPREPERRAKYRNTKVEVDGQKFDSKKEAARWQKLQLLEAAGHIQDLRRQVAFELAPAVVLDGRKKPALRYFADLVYMEDGLLVVEDVKSEITRKNPVHRIKKHLMATVHKIFIKET